MPGSLSLPQPDPASLDDKPNILEAPYQLPTPNSVIVLLADVGSLGDRG